MIEETLASLTEALKENTSVLREVLAASGAPTNVTPITEAPKPAKKQKVEKPPVVEPEAVAVVEPEAVAVVEPEAVAVVEPEPMTVVADFAASQAAEAFRATLDPESLITQITDSWKAQLTAADPARKAMLKDKFPELRAKWGLAADAKLATLSPTPEKLAGLLADIKDL